ECATAAILVAAAPDRAEAPHQVSKLYYIAWTKGKWDAYQAALKTLRARVDGVERQATPWPEWAVTTVIDTGDYWPSVWRAVSCHRTQMTSYRTLQSLPNGRHHALWGPQAVYR